MVSKTFVFFLALVMTAVFALSPARALSAEGEAAAQGHIQELMDAMTLEEKIYQLFIVKPETVAGVKTATKATSVTQKGLGKYPVGGLIYFSANIVKEAQITEMIARTQEFAREKRGIGLFISVDEEGGSVARVAKKLGIGKTESMKKIGERGNLQEAYGVGETIGKNISRLGFNLDFAPVADVIIDSRNTEIGSRSFGTDAGMAAGMAAQVVKGLQENGVMATLKHFPGHGSTTANSHNGASITTRTLEQMEETEFAPFRAGIAAGAEFVMMSHLTAVEIDKEYPASLSKTIVTGLLRERLGFNGLITTDALRMKAVSSHFSSGEAAVLALEAGVDVLLLPYNFANAVKGVREAVSSGRISEARIDESVERILLVKWKYGLIEE